MKVTIHHRFRRAVSALLLAATALLSACSVGPQAYGGITSWKITPPEKVGGVPTIEVSDGKEGYVYVRYEKKTDGTVTVEYTGRRSAAAMIRARVEAEKALSQFISQDAIPGALDALMRGLAPMLGP